MSAAFERYEPTIREAFGDGTEPIARVAQRASSLFSDEDIIVWEGDAQTFQFSFVSASAETLLGHPVGRWTNEATFWADHVVHPDDRDDAIGYCALATGRRRDHAFEYRAKAADGSTRRLIDYVQVIIGSKGVPVRLRGIMIDVSSSTQTSTARWQNPTVDALQADL